jgi:hypothetical protein
MADEKKPSLGPNFDRFMFKSTSARFLMASITTMTACFLTSFIVYKYPDSALTQSLVTQFFTVWTSIVSFYFGTRVGEDKMAARLAQAPPVPAVVVTT